MSPLVAAARSNAVTIARARTWLGLSCRMARAISLTLGRLSRYVLSVPRSWATIPRFTEENRAANQALVDLVGQVARAHDATPAQVALAWLLARSPNLLLIPGTSSIEHLEENLESAARVLGPVELEELDRIGGTGELDPDL